MAWRLLETEADECRDPLINSSLPITTVGSWYLSSVTWVIFLGWLEVIYSLVDESVNPPRVDTRSYVDE